jgi:hypothetical protein
VERDERVKGVEMKRDKMPKIIEALDESAKRLAQTV